MMAKVTARDFCHKTEQEMWQLPEGQVTVTFDDGSVVTNYGALRFSWYLWKPFRTHTTAPILKKHHVGDREISSNTHLDILSDITWDITEYTNYSADREDLGKLAYEATNELYNAFTSNADRYVTSLDIFDFIDIVEHPEIKAANDALRPHEASITKTHHAISKILLTDPALANNGVAKAARAGLTPMAQILQCVSAVGFRTEVDSNIFRHPILTGFVHGIVKLHDAMIESRSASKALKFAKDPLRTAEYFNRKLQLGCENVQSVHIGDCGSTQYIRKKLHKSDLKNMAGKYYVTDKGIKAITKHDTHLVDKTILMRSSLYCIHPDQHGVCSTCFGEIAFNIPRGTNLGHVSATALGEKGSQHIMSTKHLDGTSTVDNIEVTESDSRFIRAQEGETSIHLSDRVSGLKVKMIVRADEAKSLTDIGYTDNIRALNIHNLTSLTDVRFIVDNGRTIDDDIVAVSMGSRHAALTHEALEYLKYKTWALTPSGDYEINLTDWDTSQPLFELPRKHVSVVEYVTSIEAKIIGNGGKQKGKMDLRALYNYEDPEEALFALYDLVTSALDVNIAHLEVIMFAMMVRDPKNYDYNLPHGGEPIYFGKFREIMSMRSLAPKMAYETQIDSIYSPESYLITDRPPHIIDDLLMG
jgi:hypothetical protein